MKKLLLLLFSLTLSFNSYGYWIYIDKEKNSDAEIYVQTESIEVDEDYVYWMYLNDYSEPRSEYNIMGLAIFRGGDCENNRYVNIESQMFQGSKGTKPFGDRLKPEQEWTTPTSGQIDEKIFNYVCDYAGFGQVEVEAEEESELVTYSCESFEGSAFFGISKATKKPFNYGISGHRQTFTINADKSSVWIHLDSNSWAGTVFDILDYYNDNNFTAQTPQTPYVVHSSLFFKDGYLFLNWMGRNEDDPQISVQVSKCSLM
tara:strand:- start:600 stop:1376 length:777 start_codon:yes stop_codon:yes gene_type:complete